MDKSKIENSNDKLKINRAGRIYKVKDVDSYIAASTIEARPILEELRKILKSTLPEVEEGISWGVPFYKYYGILAGFSALMNHVSFGLVTVLTEEERKILEEKGYKTGKKTIQIQFDQKIPTTMIKQIIKEKAKMNEANGKKT
jgi:uncharacterized protein YdhG (YjbR/CyaY superfamily)